MRLAGLVTFLMTSSIFSMVWRASLMVSSWSATWARTFRSALRTGSPMGSDAMVRSSRSRAVMVVGAAVAPAVGGIKLVGSVG